jgi:hypothetical protein
MLNFERDLIRERQREGIALAKLRGGAYTSLKHSLTPAKEKELRRRVRTGFRGRTIRRRMLVALSAGFADVLWQSVHVAAPLMNMEGYVYATWRGSLGILASSR